MCELVIGNLSFVCVISGVCLQLARYCLSETIPTQTSPQTSILFVCSDQPRARVETCRVNCDNQPNGGEDNGDYAAGAIKMQRYNHGGGMFCR